MPLHYGSIIQEHQKVREKAGIFDVSHMGKIEIEGDDAGDFLDFLSTNEIKNRPNLSATYTVFPNREGGCIDDVIIYKNDDTHYFLIANAGNRERTLNHLLKESLPFQVSVLPHYSEEGILSLQGPSSLEIAESLFPDVGNLKKMSYRLYSFQQKTVAVAATGYTGSWE